MIQHTFQIAASLLLACAAANCVHAVLDKALHQIGTAKNPTKFSDKRSNLARAEVTMSAGA